MKYSLVGITNVFDMVFYVKQCMKQCGNTPFEIDAYLNAAVCSDFDNLLSVSNSVIEKLNERHNSTSELV